MLHIDIQDQLATTSSNYEKQLSTMSDHLCELNDKLLKQNEEIEDLKRPSKVHITVVSECTELCMLVMYVHRAKEGASNYISATYA